MCFLNIRWIELWLFINEFLSLPYFFLHTRAVNLTFFFSILVSYHKSLILKVYLSVTNDLRKSYFVLNASATMTEIGMVGVFDPNLDSVLALADNGFFQLTWNQVPQVTDISGTFPVQVNKGELDRKISIECMLIYFSGNFNW